MKAILAIFWLFSWAFSTPTTTQAHAVGYGKADITGPIGEVDLMGYAKMGQSANGIHLRLFARAFVFGNSGERLVYVSIDTGQTSQFVKDRVIKHLNNSHYSEENVMISAIHTHSGPAGYLDHFLYVANTFGIVPGEREAIAIGITTAIQIADEMFEKSLIDPAMRKSLTIQKGRVFNASRNRSPTSYLRNPEEERSKYDADVDRTMTILGIRSSDNDQITSFISWFPVHGVSMNSSYHYVSGDNKGFASHLWESKNNQNFVAAFSISNAGDVTSNLQSPRCIDTGLPCDGGRYSCPNGKGKFNILKCIASGPSMDNFESTKIIGTRQAEGAKTIVDSHDRVLITDPNVRYRHIWIDMSNVTIHGTKQKTCSPAMGQSFSAGTTDGPGAEGQWQGLGNGSISLVRLSHGLNRILAPGRGLPKASAAIQACHEPKKVLLATGEFTVPYVWQPSIVPLQIFIIGRKLVIIGQPSEITTMAGRRLRDAVFNQLKHDNSVDQDASVVIAGLSNTYSSYVTTFEEYQAQRYEGGSTIFGPHTLQAYIQKFTELASTFSDLTMSSMSNYMPFREGDYKELSFNNKLVHHVFRDAGNFGKILRDVPNYPAVSGDVITARFQCSHPRNHGFGRKFLVVERKEFNNSWVTELTDGQWDTKFMWFKKGNILSPRSECEVSWKINETISVPKGIYRLRIYGTFKTLGGNLKLYDGTTQDFQVV